MLLRSIAISGLLLLIASAAHAQCTAQTTPNFYGGGNLWGRTAPQVNAYFGAKVDVANGCVTAFTVNGGVLNNVTANLQPPGSNNSYLATTQFVTAAIGSAAELPVVVTGSGGTFNITATNTLWEPTAPAATTLTLPATPMSNEVHTVQYRAATGNFPLTIAPNAGQTINSEPYMNLVLFGNSITVRYVGANVWIVYP
jgi:hypothetical protein